MLKVRNIVVLPGAVKIYVAAVEALRKRERQDETQFSLPQNNRWFSEFHPSLMLMYFFFCKFFLNLISCNVQTQGSGCCAFPCFMDNYDF
jgi:hypothetical protein